MELEPGIDDGHDDSAQIDHTQQFWGGIGNPGGRNVGADFLDLHDVDAVLRMTQSKGKALVHRIERAVGTEAGCSFQHSHRCTS